MALCDVDGYWRCKPGKRAYTDTEKTDIVAKKLMKAIKKEVNMKLEEFDQDNKPLKRRMRSLKKLAKCVSRDIGKKVTGMLPLSAPGDGPSADAPPSGSQQERKEEKDEKDFKEGQDYPFMPEHEVPDAPDLDFKHVTEDGDNAPKKKRKHAQPPPKKKTIQRRPVERAPSKKVMKQLLKNLDDKETRRVAKKKKSDRLLADLAAIDAEETAVQPSSRYARPPPPPGRLYGLGPPRWFDPTARFYQPK
jgi:hypothetical protein